MSGADEAHHLPDSLQKFFKVVLGMEWPEASEAGLAEIQSAWEGFSRQLGVLDAALVSGAADVDGALDGQFAQALTGYVGGDLVTGVRELTAQSDDLVKATKNTLADVQKSKIIMIAMAALALATVIELLATIIFAWMVPAVEVAAQVGIRLAMRQLIQKIQSITVRQAAKTAGTLAVDMAKFAAFGASVMGGLDALVQGIQIANDDRDGFDVKSFENSVIGGAIGGAGAGVAHSGAKFIRAGARDAKETLAKITPSGKATIPSYMVSLGQGGYAGMQMLSVLWTTPLVNLVTGGHESFWGGFLGAAGAMGGGGDRAGGKGGEVGGSGDRFDDVKLDPEKLKIEILDSPDSASPVSEKFAESILSSFDEKSPLLLSGSDGASLGTVFKSPATGVNQTERPAAESDPLSAGSPKNGVAPEPGGVPVEHGSEQHRGSSAERPTVEGAPQSAGSSQAAAGPESAAGAGDGSKAQRFLRGETTHGENGQLTGHSPVSRRDSGFGADLLSDGDSGFGEGSDRGAGFGDGRASASGQDIGADGSMADGRPASNRDSGFVGDPVSAPGPASGEAPTSPSQTRAPEAVPQAGRGALTPADSSVVQPAGSKAASPGSVDPGVAQPGSKVVSSGPADSGRAPGAKAAPPADVSPSHPGSVSVRNSPVSGALADSGGKPVVSADSSVVPPASKVAVPPPAYTPALSPVVDAGGKPPVQSVSAPKAEPVQGHGEPPAPKVSAPDRVRFAAEPMRLEPAQGAGPADGRASDKPAGQQSGAARDSVTSKDTQAGLVAGALALGGQGLLADSLAGADGAAPRGNDSGFVSTQLWNELRESAPVTRHRDERFIREGQDGGEINRIRFDVRRGEVTPGQWVQELSVPVDLVSWSGAVDTRTRQGWAEKLQRVLDERVNGRYRFPDGAQAHFVIDAGAPAGPTRPGWETDPMRGVPVEVVTGPGEFGQLVWQLGDAHAAVGHLFGFVGLGSERGGPQLTNADIAAIDDAVRTTPAHTPAEGPAPSPEQPAVVNDGLGGEAQATPDPLTRPGTRWADGAAWSRDGDNWFVTGDAGALDIGGETGRVDLPQGSRGVFDSDGVLRHVVLPDGVSFERGLTGAWAGPRVAMGEVQALKLDDAVPLPLADGVFSLAPENEVVVDRAGGVETVVAYRQLKDDDGRWLPRPRVFVPDGSGGWTDHGIDVVGYEAWLAGANKAPDAAQTLYEFAGRSAGDVPVADRLTEMSTERLGELYRGGSEAGAFAAVFELIRREKGIALRYTQVMAVQKASEGWVDHMSAGEGKSWLFFAHAAIHAAKPGITGVQMTTTRANLADREVKHYQGLLGKLGGDAHRLNSDSPPPAPRDGRPTIYLGTAEDVGFTNLKKGTLPGQMKPEDTVWLTVSIDEIDEAVVYSNAQYVLSEGVAAPAAEEVKAAVAWAHDLVRDSMERRWLSEADFGRRAGQVGGQARLTAEGVEKVELQLERPLSEAEVSRVNMAAAARWEYKENVHFVQHKGKIYIIDQTTHQVMFNPETSSESRWNGGLAQAVEYYLGLEVRSDPDSSKSVTLHELLNKPEYVRKTGASGTAKGHEKAFAALGMSKGVAEIPRYYQSRVKKFDDVVAVDEQVKLDQMAADIQEMQSEKGSGRPQLVLAHRNDLVSELHTRLDALGVEHVAIDAKWFLEQGTEGEAAFAAAVDTAGNTGKVTVVNMQGGRGVDIVATLAAKAKGDLMLRVTAHSKIKDIDTQATARAGRSGGGGGAVYYSSPKDEIYELSDNPDVQLTVIKYTDAVKSGDADVLAGTEKALRKLVPELQSNSEHPTVDIATAQPNAPPASSIADPESPGTASHDRPLDEPAEDPSDAPVRRDSLFDESPDNEPGLKLSQGFGEVSYDDVVASAVAVATADFGQYLADWYRVSPGLVLPDPDVEQLREGFLNDRKAELEQLLAQLSAKPFSDRDERLAWLEWHEKLQGASDGLPGLFAGLSIQDGVSPGKSGRSVPLPVDRADAAGWVAGEGERARGRFGKRDVDVVRPVAEKAVGIVSRYQQVPVFVDRSALSAADAERVRVNDDVKDLVTDYLLRGGDERGAHELARGLAVTLGTSRTDRDAKPVLPGGTRPDLPAATTGESSNSIISDDRPQAATDDTPAIAAGRDSQGRPHPDAEVVRLSGGLVDGVALFQERLRETSAAPADVVGWRPAADETGPRDLREYLIERGVARRMEFLRSRLGELPTELLLDIQEQVELDPAPVDWVREWVHSIATEDIRPSTFQGNIGVIHAPGRIVQLSGGLLGGWWTVQMARSRARVNWEGTLATPWSHHTVRQMVQGFVDAAVQESADAEVRRRPVVLPRIRAVAFTSGGTGAGAEQLSSLVEEVVWDRVEEYRSLDVVEVSEEELMVRVDIRPVELPEGDPRVGEVQVHVEGQRRLTGLYGPEAYSDSDNPLGQTRSAQLGRARKELAAARLNRESHEALFARARAIVATHNQPPRVVIGPRSRVDEAHLERYRAAVDLVAAILHRRRDDDPDRVQSAAEFLSSSLVNVMGWPRESGLLGLGRPRAGGMAASAGELGGRAGGSSEAGPSRSVARASDEVTRVTAEEPTLTVEVGTVAETPPAVLPALAGPVLVDIAEVVRWRREAGGPQTLRERMLQWYREGKLPKGISPERSDTYGELSVKTQDWVRAWSLSLLKESQANAGKMLPVKEMINQSGFVIRDSTVKNWRKQVTGLGKTAIGAQEVDVPAAPAGQKFEQLWTGGFESNQSAVVAKQDLTDFKVLEPELAKSVVERRVSGVQGADYRLILYTTTKKIFLPAVREKVSSAATDLKGLLDAAVVAVPGAPEVVPDNLKARIFPAVKPLRHGKQILELVRIPDERLRPEEYRDLQSVGVEFIADGVELPFAVADRVRWLQQGEVRRVWETRRGGDTGAVVRSFVFTLSTVANDPKVRRDEREQHLQGVVDEGTRAELEAIEAEHDPIADADRGAFRAAVKVRYESASRIGGRGHGAFENDSNEGLGKTPRKIAQVLASSVRSGVQAEDRRVLVREFQKIMPVVVERYENGLPPLNLQSNFRSNKSAVPAASVLSLMSGVVGEIFGDELADFLQDRPGKVTAKDLGMSFPVGKKSYTWAEKKAGGTVPGLHVEVRPDRLLDQTAEEYLSARVLDGLEFVLGDSMLVDAAVWEFRRAVENAVEQALDGTVARTVDPIRLTVKFNQYEAADLIAARERYLRSLVDDSFDAVVARLRPRRPALPQDVSGFRPAVTADLVTGLKRGTATLRVGENATEVPRVARPRPQQSFSVERVGGRWRVLQADVGLPGLQWRGAKIRDSVLKPAHFRALLEWAAAIAPLVRERTDLEVPRESPDLVVVDTVDRLSSLTEEERRELRSAAERQVNEVVDAAVATAQGRAEPLYPADYPGLAIAVVLQHHGNGPSGRGGSLWLRPDPGGSVAGYRSAGSVVVPFESVWSELSAGATRRLGWVIEGAAERQGAVVPAVDRFEVTVDLVRGPGRGPDNVAAKEALLEVQGQARLAELSRWVRGFAGAAGAAGERVVADVYTTMTVDPLWPAGMAAARVSVNNARAILPAEVEPVPAGWLVVTPWTGDLRVTVAKATKNKESSAEAKLERRALAGLNAFAARLLEQWQAARPGTGMPDIRIRVTLTLSELNHRKTILDYVDKELRKLLTDRGVDLGKLGWKFTLFAALATRFESSVSVSVMPTTLVTEVQVRGSSRWEGGFIGRSATKASGKSLPAANDLPEAVKQQVTWRVDEYARKVAAAQRREEKPPRLLALIVTSGPAQFEIRKGELRKVIRDALEKVSAERGWADEFINDHILFMASAAWPSSVGVDVSLTEVPADFGVLPKPKSKLARDVSGNSPVLQDIDYDDYDVGVGGEQSRPGTGQGADVVMRDAADEDIPVVAGDETVSGPVDGSAEAAGNYRGANVGGAFFAAMLAADWDDGFPVPGPAGPVDDDYTAPFDDTYRPLVFDDENPDMPRFDDDAWGAAWTGFDPSFDPGSDMNFDPGFGAGAGLSVVPKEVLAEADAARAGGRAESRPGPVSGFDVEGHAMVDVEGENPLAWLTQPSSPLDLDLDLDLDMPDAQALNSFNWDTGLVADGAVDVPVRAGKRRRSDGSSPVGDRDRAGAGQVKVRVGVVLGDVTSPAGLAAGMLPWEEGVFGVVFAEGADRTHAVVVEALWAGGWNGQDAIRLYACELGDLEQLAEGLNRELGVAVGHPLEQLWLGMRGAGRAVRVGTQQLAEDSSLFWDVDHDGGRWVWHITPTPRDPEGRVDGSYALDIPHDEKLHLGLDDPIHLAPANPPRHPHRTRTRYGLS